EFRHRSSEVVTDAALVGEELGGHYGADRVAADVLRSRPAGAISVEPGHRVGAAWLQLTAEHIAIAHAVSISRWCARPPTLRSLPRQIIGSSALTSTLTS